MTGPENPVKNSKIRKHMFTILDVSTLENQIEKENL